jgi:hypothetical protein
LGSLEAEQFLVLCFGSYVWVRVFRD